MPADVEKPGRLRLVTYDWLVHLDIQPTELKPSVTKTDIVD